ncbi:MAG: CatB-related O-acetyltransferase [Longimicrobiales bacterium]
MRGPSPSDRHPIAGAERVGFLKNLVTRPNIQVGDYSYYDDPDGVDQFEKNVLYHFDFIGDQLIIGRFCSIAAETRFIMNGGNHALDWFTTFPFPVFGGGWETAMPESWPNRGDTIVGHDVWIGYGATIMPGVQIGNGAIIATKSVVTKDVEPFAIVGGNPSQLIRYRFDEETRERLTQIAWWDWNAEKITRNVAAICSNDLRALESAE